jgi:hypothetical protein
MDQIVDGITGVDELTRRIDRLEVMAWVAIGIGVLSIVLQLIGEWTKKK